MLVLKPMGVNFESEKFPMTTIDSAYVEFPISRDEIVLYFDIFRQKVIDATRQVYAVGRPTNPFNAVGGDFDDFDDGLEDF